MNSQAKVQNEINLHNQKGRLVQVECKWWDEFNRGNFKPKKLQGSFPLGGGTTPPL
jgi:hypothetical protein